MSDPGRMCPSFGAKVTVPRLRYSVEGTVEAFCLVGTSDSVVAGAVIRVTQDKGLYRRGDIITAPVASLRAVTA